MTNEINIHYYCNEYGCGYCCDVRGLPRSEDGKFHMSPYICPNPVDARVSGISLCIELKEQE